MASIPTTIFVVPMAIAYAYCDFGPNIPVVVEECEHKWDDVVDQAQTNGFAAFDKYGGGGGQLVGFGLTGGARKLGEYEGDYNE